MLKIWPREVVNIKVMNLKYFMQIKSYLHEDVQIYNSKNF